ncbi:type IX secretion system protein PorD [Daejeonella lutea]|uniref:DUF4835 domain-containing protein n=1 Tax=Daejeonella lutea TaxID=572036 RepID=A0A1T5FDZ1_9SPHI|nr:DUF4835 family protein [Daejeonella lutea]SKB94326.1 protein of unknown function [Daejeonella lutea]
MRVVLLFFLLLGSVAVHSQDLNARVQILAPQIPNANKRILDVLEVSIKDFLNGRRWTADALQPQERIDCNFVITITEWDGSSANFKAEAQIQSSRPIYNSNYNSTILNLNDKDFTFSYSEGQALDYSDQNYLTNLTSLLAFYAYIITGMDYDTFSKLGGTPYFQKAQTVLNNAQNAPNLGWKAHENLRNRFWIMENLLNKAYNPIRESMYEYHRDGLDVMAENPSKGRKAIYAVLPQLQKIDKQKQGAILNQVFFTAKSDELINILSDADPQEKLKAFTILSAVDPANALKYEILKRSR